MKKYAFLLLAIHFIGFVLQGQAPCGTSFETQAEQRQRLIQNRENAQHHAERRDDLVYVPIKFHLVGKSDSSSTIHEKQVLDMLCMINTEFADQEIQFYLDYPFHYLFNDTLYEHESETYVDSVALLQKVNDAINFFIIGNFGPANFLGYYQGPPVTRDYMVIQKQATDEFVPSHLLGHFFSLAHPFFGWTEPWDEDIHGIQVDSLTGFGVLVEKMDMSNCAYAADAICDTPPDYLFAFSDGQSGCEEWAGGTLDPCGVLVDPMENNMMSYFSQCSDYVFTEEQKLVIRMDYESADRAYIQTAYIPNLSEISGGPELLEPIDGQVSPGFSSVDFEWEAVDGAGFYLLEIDFFPTFSGASITFVTENTGMTVSGIFEAGKTYYWRVLPFNEYQVCGLEYSETQAFQSNIIDGIAEIHGIRSFLVLPNPVRSGRSLNLNFTADQSFSGFVQLFNEQGQPVAERQSLECFPGKNHQEIKLAGLVPGVYTLLFRFDEHRMFRKIVLTD